MLTVRKCQTSSGASAQENNSTIRKLATTCTTEEGSNRNCNIATYKISLFCGYFFFAWEKMANVQKPNEAGLYICILTN
jgi:hypothetical protein